MLILTVLVVAIDLLLLLLVILVVAMMMMMMVLLELFPNLLISQRPTHFEEFSGEFAKTVRRHLLLHEGK